MKFKGGALLFVTIFGCADAHDASLDQSANGVPYWGAGSTTDEGKSTHLFIVNRAVAILGKHQTLPKAARAFARLNDPACSARWRLGLDEADSKVGYNNWWSWKSHFFDPSTGTNYQGGTDPVAYNEALKYLSSAKSRLAGGDVQRGCYELGLALHYVTDIMQPMHAANFAATDQPIQLHSHLEDRAADVQAQFVANDWTSTPTGTVNALLTNLAWTSHTQWTGMWGALANAYASRCDDIDSYTFDRTSCWSGDAGVDAQIGVSLRSSQTGTAAFLYAADLP
jgi:phospholipase C